MNSTFTVQLILHVMAGLLSIAGLSVVWMHLYKDKFHLFYLRNVSLMSAIFIVISWYMASKYYVGYYGQTIKTIVTGGNFPWAHAFIMEMKEHIFLYLPFLAVGLTITLWLLNDEQANEPMVKKRLISLFGVATLLGIVVTLSGVIVSGAVR